MTARLLDNQIGTDGILLEQQRATVEPYTVDPKRLCVVKAERRISTVKPERRIVNVQG